MGKLDGKIALVTGGSSGIGLATAQAFREEGARVVITGRNGATLTAAASELGAGVLPIVADVTSIADLERLFATVQSELGGLDVLFVNAGIASFSPLPETSEAFFDEMMNINFKGAFFTIQKALPVLRDGASIVLNGSVNAHIGFENSAIYAASKAALHSLARTLSVELMRRRIRINTLTIGPVETPLYGKLGLPPEVLQGFATTMTGKLPIGRFAQPLEIGRAAVFLASDDSSYVVGSELLIDGGLLLNTL